jgi:mRNA interferase MazF
VEALTQFEIWWAELPAPAGTRPVLLLSRPSAYAYLSKFIVAEITTNLRNISTEVPLGEEEGLPRNCAANCDNLRMVPGSMLARKAGILAPDRWVEVKRAVGAAFAWRELTDLD